MNGINTRFNTPITAEVRNRERLVFMICPQANHSSERKPAKTNRKMSVAVTYSPYCDSKRKIKILKINE